MKTASQGDTPRPRWIAAGRPATARATTWPSAPAGVWERRSHDAAPSRSAASTIGPVRLQDHALVEAHEGHAEAPNRRWTAGDNVRSARPLRSFSRSTNRFRNRAGKHGPSAASMTTSAGPRGASDPSSGTPGAA